MLKKFDSYDGLCFFDGLVFFAPVALLIRTQAGVSMSTFLLLQALLSCIIFIGEIPAGIVSDKIGYKNTIVLSQLTLLFARTILLFAFLNNSLTLFIVEAIVEGIAHCFASGTNSAYLYEVYGKDNYLLKLTHSDNCGTAGFIISTLSYFIIYRLYDLIGLLIATIISGIASSICALLLRKEVRNVSFEENDNNYSITKVFSMLCNGKVLFIVILSSILSISGILISFFYVEKLSISGIPVEWLSIIILVYSVISMYAERIVNQLVNEPKWKVMLVSCVISGISMIVFGQTVNKVLVIGLMLVMPLLISIPSYFLGEIENTLIDEINLGQNRATSLSILSMSINLLDIVTLFASSIFTKIGISICFLFVGIMLLIGALVFIFGQKSFN